MRYLSFIDEELAAIIDCLIANHACVHEIVFNKTVLGENKALKTLFVRDKDSEVQRISKYVKNSSSSA